MIPPLPASTKLLLLPWIGRIAFCSVPQSLVHGSWFTHPWCLHRWSQGHQRLKKSPTKSIINATCLSRINSWHIESISYFPGSGLEGLNDYSAVFVVELLSHVQLFSTPWTIVCQAPLFIGFPRQEYWSGLPLPSPEDLPNPRIKPWSPALQVVSWILYQQE